MPYLVDIPITNLNFYKKIYTAILQSYLHIEGYKPEGRNYVFQHFEINAKNKKRIMKF